MSIASEIKNPANDVIIAYPIETCSKRINPIQKPAIVEKRMNKKSRNALYFHAITPKITKRTARNNNGLGRNS
jgi:hypothetical protein